MVNTNKIDYGQWFYDLLKQFIQQNTLRNMSDESKDITTTTAAEEELEYEEEFEIEITTQKGSSIKVETSSYDKLDDLINKAFTTYQRLTKEESGGVEEKLQYQ